MIRYVSALRFGSCLLIWALCVQMALHPAAAQEITIEGIVRGPDQSPLPNTTVRIYQSGKLSPVKSVRTDEDGRYRFTLPASGSALNLKYDYPGKHLSFVNAISGFAGDNQVINIVLLKTEGPKSFDLIVKQIMVYDQARIIEQFGDVAFLDEAEQQRRTAELRDQYGERILSIPHPLRYKLQGEEQREVIRSLTPIQTNVIDRLMGDLLFRYGYTKLPVYRLPLEPSLRESLGPDPTVLVAPPAPNANERFAANLGIRYVMDPQNDGTFEAIVSRLPEPDTVGFKKGIEPGDVIKSLDGQSFREERDLTDVLNPANLEVFNIRTDDARIRSYDP